MFKTGDIIKNIDNDNTHWKILGTKGCFYITERVKSIGFVKVGFVGSLEINDNNLELVKSCGARDYNKHCFRM